MCSASFPSLGVADPLCDALNQQVAEILDSTGPQDKASAAEQDLLLKSYGEEKGIVPKFLEGVGPAHQRIKDRPFGDFEFLGATIIYETLPPEVRGQGLVEPVYYGRSVKNLENAREQLRMFFQYGRTRRGKLHRSVDRHISAISVQDSATGEVSAFLQTTKSIVAADYFAVPMQDTGAGSKVGLVLIIDPKGAQLLDIMQADATKVLDTERLNSPFVEPEGEQEVLFAESIPAHRIYGALLLKGSARYAETDEVRDQEMIEIVKNPNYRRQRN